MSHANPSHSSQDRTDLQASYLSAGGILLAYILFFLPPTFFSGTPELTRPQPFPYLGSLGFDLEQLASYATSWRQGNSLYVGLNLYPPIASLLAVPLLSLSAQARFLVITYGSLFSLIGSLFLAQRYLSPPHPRSPTIAIAAISALFSYGLLFELERGQFNLIACFFGLLGVALHTSDRNARAHRGRRFWGLFFLSLAVQLKIYPAIFFLLLWHPQRSKDWIIEGIFFAIINFGLFGILGVSTLFEFLEALSKQMREPYVWIGNHSFYAFIAQLPGRLGLALQHHSLLRGATQLALVAISFAPIGIWMHSHRVSGKNPALLNWCILMSLMLPGVSHDYKLSLLPIALTSMLSWHWQSSSAISTRIVQALLLLLYGFAYGCTLFSYSAKSSFFFQSAFPSLLLMLFCGSGLALTSFLGSKSRPPSELPA